MRFIPAKQLESVALEKHETLFLDCWYGLTHMRSLDSYRVRCLNARTIVRELCEELAIGRLDEPEFQGICQEALFLLQNDSVISTAFPKSLGFLSPLLETPPSLQGKGQEKEKRENQARLQNLQFAAADLSAVLDRRYSSELCSQLLHAIEQKACDRIESLTNAFLSDLASRGWSLHALFQWHRKFLEEDDYSFGDNLRFMIRQLSRPAESFEVTLRINGGSRLGQLTGFGKFTISKTSDLSPRQNAEKRFAAPDKYSVFAKGVFQSVDSSSAAMTARDELEPLLDAMRFEYEPGLLEVDSRTWVRRVGGGREWLHTLTNPVPNPVESLDDQDFDAFSDRLATALGSPTLDQESKNRIETALRRYRFGRDSHSYCDKFLNWWMGIEALCNVGDGKIGRNVTRNVKHAMLTGYTFRLLRDFLITLKYLGIPWNEAYSQASGADGIAALDVAGLAILLQDQAAAQILWGAVDDRPLVQLRGQRIASWLSEPAKLAEQLSSHKKRLQWHVDRLYRIRCCIVHGSPIRFPLPLYSANLEYYLKQTLIFTLNTLHEHKHITDLASLFQRCVIMWERQLGALRESDATLDTVNDAVLAKAVTED